jgi:hypothetical protein
MKPRLALTEVVTIIAVLLFLAALFLSMLAKPKHYPGEVQCMNNLRQISSAMFIWAGDHNGQFPMSVSATNGGAMELIGNGNVAALFQTISNKLGTPKFFICPMDTEHRVATNFQNGFNNSHISYFVNLDANENYPHVIFLGDDNLVADGVPVKSGILGLPHRGPFSWTSARHGRVGNIGFSDGSITAMTSYGLKQALKYSLETTPTGTNRLAIP